MAGSSLSKQDQSKPGPASAPTRWYDSTPMEMPPFHTTAGDTLPSNSLSRLPSHRSQSSMVNIKIGMGVSGTLCHEIINAALQVGVTKESHSLTHTLSLSLSSSLSHSHSLTHTLCLTPSLSFFLRVKDISMKRHGRTQILILRHVPRCRPLHPARCGARFAASGGLPRAICLRTGFEELHALTPSRWRSHFQVDGAQHVSQEKVEGKTSKLENYAQLQFMIKQNQMNHRELKAMAMKSWLLHENDARIWEHCSANRLKNDKHVGFAADVDNSSEVLHRTINIRIAFDAMILELDRV